MSEQSKYQGKAITDFTIKDWKNVGIFFVFAGLLSMFLTDNFKLGLGLFAVGILFLAIFQGPKILKILKTKNW